MNIIKTIFAHPALLEKPPVLFDIGASTALPEQWRSIAPYSICVAFDPDRRQMEYIENESGFKKLYTFPAIVHESNTNKVNFHLATSPECSSTLEPDMESLKDYLFAGLFTTEQTAELPSTTIVQVLEQLKIDYIDWFKTDTQGTDLRLFKSIPESIRHKIIAAEFEPGIIDAYVCEDKMWQIMEFLGHEPFWCNSFKVLGTARFTPDTAQQYCSKLERKVLNTVMPEAPGWTEIMFLNKFSGSNFTIREFLLGYLFALEKQQYGESLRLAELGTKIFGDAIFTVLHQHVVHKIKQQCLCSPALPLKIFRKLASLIKKG